MMAKTKKLGVTATLLALLLACSLIVLIASLAMVFYSQASLVITVLTIVLGGSLLAWHIRVLIGGSGRTKSTITTNFSIALIVIGCFAMITGFGLFDVLGGRVEPTRIVLAIAGFIGLVCALIAFIRDTGQEHEARESEEKKEELGESESDDSALEAGDDVLESSDDGSLESSDDDLGATPSEPTAVEEAESAAEVEESDVEDSDEPLDSTVALYETPGPETESDVDDFSAAEMTMIVPPPSPRARRAAASMDDLTWLYDSPEAAKAEEEEPRRARRGI
ncbi:hypothetical protein QP568_05405 [Propionimicrobium lymphophilum]|uniref:hypothetical protein n=2 Tax=Propionibacteriaceae TaxID=31957 RepID=UPI00055F2276|nr:hypothetical protein [Propionimicrobium lymphophilum]MDK7733725.1 hypothetical protein [Propionimicrobium lymphophilum]